jgi:hypothetical protein
MIEFVAIGLCLVLWVLVLGMGMQIDRLEEKVSQLVEEKEKKS